MADETTGEGGVVREDGSKPAVPGTPGAPRSGAPSPLEPIVSNASRPPTPPVPISPATPPTSVESSPGEEPLKADIAKILKDIKLPERRSLPGQAEKEPAKIPISTVLGESAPDEPKEADVPATPHPPQNPTGVNAIHTLKHDIEGVVHDRKISYVRAAALEQEKKRPAEAFVSVSEKRSSRVMGIVFAAFLLLFLGGAALAGVYFVAMQNAATPPAQTLDSLVFAEQTVAFPIDGGQPSDLKAQLAQARLASNASLGSITRVVPVTGVTETGDGAVATLSDFLTAIGARAPEELLRALSDEFFFGIHTVDENAPILVIPVLSYDRAFAGMLEWENTMNEDLAPAFFPLPRLTTGPDGIPTERRFTDMVRNNYDIRALTDDSGTIQLYYSFPARGILIIAESPFSFTEILNRLQAGRRL